MWTAVPPAKSIAAEGVGDPAADVVTVPSSAVRVKSKTQCATGK
jgi:hypothetical protein